MDFKIVDLANHIGLVYADLFGFQNIAEIQNLRNCWIFFGSGYDWNPE